MTRPLTAFWQAISEVPGWPDAPLTVRLRRLWPIALPLLACVGVTTWIHIVREPHHDAVRMAHAGLVGLEGEIAALHQACSEQIAAETTARASEVRGWLLGSPAALEARMQAFATHARTLGWESSFQVYGLADEGSAAGPARFVLAPARLRLEPQPGNPDIFNSLLAVLASLTGATERIELTRVAIRADQPGVPVVEVNIRAACRLEHEKATQ